MIEMVRTILPPLQNINNFSVECNLMYIKYTNIGVVHVFKKKEACPVMPNFWTVSTLTAKTFFRADLMKDISII